MYIHVYTNTAFQNTSIVLGISFRHVLYLRTLFLVIDLYFSDFNVISSLNIVKRDVMV
jgi:hypothetical protein